MTKRAVRRGVYTINPMFYIPEDVDELVYDDGGLNALLEVEELDESYDVSIEYDDGTQPDDSDYNSTPETPQVLYLVPPQQFRMTDAGMEVVDVILEVEDVLDADKYEFRVTKI